MFDTRVMCPQKYGVTADRLCWAHLVAWWDPMFLNKKTKEKANLIIKRAGFWGGVLLSYYNDGNLNAKAKLHKDG
jgi:hypothetical protein